MLALQRGAGNAAVAQALARRALQRVGGWKGADPKSPNAGERTVTDKASGFSARRIPIDGIPEGNKSDDLQSTAVTEVQNKNTPEQKIIEHKTAEYTSETSSGGKAIVVLPVGVKLAKDDTVDVLVHLHGHTVGYRRQGATTRDLGVERIEEQVAAAAAGGKRPLIAVLPQGRFKSSFGAGGRSFDPAAYLDSVWKILTGLSAWGLEGPPQRGGLMLSSHSGGDAPLEDMLGQAQAAGTGPVADLKALFLLDTMYGPKDVEKVVKFVRFRLGHDLAHLVGMRNAGASDKELEDWIRAHGFRLRGAHSGGHYKPQMKALATAVTAWLAEADTVTALGPPGSSLSAAVAANIVIDPPGGSGVDHNAFVGENDHLRKALELVP